MREFQGIQYLSVSDSTTITEIEEIGEIITQSACTEDSNANSSKEGEIVAVQYAEEYVSCLICKGKVTEINMLMGECKKCSLKFCKQWLMQVCGIMARQLLVRMRTHTVKHMVTKTAILSIADK